jgi:hypothetical protein
MSMTRLKPFVFYSIILCLMVALLELMAAAAYFIAFGHAFSYENAQAVRNGLIKASSEAGPTPGDQHIFETIHPYYGFVTSPEIIGWSVNKFGFSGHEDQIQRANRDKIILAIVGGSVAAQFSQYARNALSSELQKIFNLQKKELVILNLANAGYKQPQALFVVNDIISRGGHIDILVSLDGFNEIALPEAHGNIFNGISPFYPQAWRYLVETNMSRRQLNHLAKSQMSSDARWWLASFFSKPIIRRSISMNLVWQIVENELAKREALYRAAAMKDPPVEPGSRLSNDKRAFLGPAADYTSRRTLYVDIAKHWGKASILLNNLMADQGGIYMHFLQPNQYVAGSKPLTDQEKRDGINAHSLYKSPVEVGYPYLRAMGHKLKASGIWFEDLTSVFAERTETLYIDNCCHLNKAGYGILAQKIAALLAAHMSKDLRCRPVGLDTLNEESILDLHVLRKIAASPDYRDGSEEPLRRAASGQRWW